MPSDRSGHRQSVILTGYTYTRRSAPVLDGIATSPEATNPIRRLSLANFLAAIVSADARRAIVQLGDSWCCGAAARWLLSSGEFPLGDCL